MPPDDHHPRRRGGEVRQPNIPGWPTSAPKTAYNKVALTPPAMHIATSALERDERPDEIEAQHPAAEADEHKSERELSPNGVSTTRSATQPPMTNATTIARVLGSADKSGRRPPRSTMRSGCAPSRRIVVQAWRPGRRAPPINDSNERSADCGPTVRRPVPKADNSSSAERSMRVAEPLEHAHVLEFIQIHERRVTRTD